MQLERQARPVAERLHDTDPGWKDNPSTFQRDSGPGVEREDNQSAGPSSVAQDRRPRSERRRLADLSPMDRHEHEAARPQPGGQVRAPRRCQSDASLQERIEPAELGGDTRCEILHQIPGLEDALDDPFRGEVRCSRGSRSKTPRREVISDDPVDLLWHSSIEAP
jgi:hypothetical protein